MRITENTILLISVVIFSSFFCSCNAQSQSSIENLDYSIGEVLISDDFSKNLSLWSVEGTQSKINYEQLELVDSAFSVIWLKPTLVGNYMLEFDFTVLNKINPDFADSGFGCFAMAIDPENQNNFFAKSNKRAGRLSGYDNLNLYHFRLDFSKKKSLQILCYDNGEQKILNNNTKSSYQFNSDQKYHVKLRFYKGTIEFHLDDECMFHYEDYQPYIKGNFGFLIEKCKITIDNFVVTHLSLP